MTADPTTAAERTAGPAVRALTLVDEGDEVLLGNPAVGAFVSVPAVGGVVIRALQRGADPSEAAVEGERFAGEPVDVAGFLAGLAEAGLLDTDAEPPNQLRRTAPIQQRRWVRGPDPRLVRPLFGPGAWCCYVTAFLFCVACFVLRPELMPTPRDAFVLDNAGLALLLLVPVSTLTAAGHESWHWLAARALGLSARFGVDRRLYFLVFETDLSQLWTVPRRKRYGPQLAGLAFDSVLLALLLGVSLLGEAGWYPASSFAGRAVSALIFSVAVGMLSQCLLFLRTDLYGVLVTGTGCRNLWEVKSLLLRRAIGRLDGAGAEQLATAHPRDLAVGRWFRWVYLAGLVVAAGYFAAIYLPIQLTLLDWAIPGLRRGPRSTDFWTTLALCVALYLPLGLVLSMWLRSSTRRIVAVVGARRPR